LLFPDQAPKLRFKNPVLAVLFSNAIWHCESAAKVCTALNEAADKALPDLDHDGIEGTHPKSTRSRLVAEPSIPMASYHRRHTTFSVAKARGQISSYDVANLQY
jgi:hypothetical protein